MKPRRMKKIIVVLSGICFSILSVAQTSSSDGKFTLSGEMLGKSKGWLIFDYMANDGKLKSDTTFVIKGKFSFEGFIAEPTLAFLRGDVKSKSVDDPNFTDFYIEPGKMSITLSPGDFKRAIITGSKTQDEKSQLEGDPVFEQLGLFDDYSDRIRDSMEQYPKNNYYKEKNDSIIKARAPLWQRFRAIHLQFIADHPHSVLSAEKLSYYADGLTPDSLTSLYNGIDSQIQNSYFGKLVGEKIGGQPGHIAPQFASTDVNGDSIYLANFKGNKYVLLVFWASWCVPCRQEDPALNNLYALYHARGLEFIGIANDDKHIDKWKKAIAEDHIGKWHQVLARYGTKNDIVKLFGVLPIPISILIDKNGEIIGRYNTLESLKNKLKMIFK